MKKLREEIQFKYFSIYNELSNGKLVKGELNVDIWGLNRDQEKEIWDEELILISDIKNDFDIAISMIESGEAEKSIIEAEIGDGQYKIIRSHHKIQ